MQEKKPKQARTDRAGRDENRRRIGEPPRVEETQKVAGSWWDDRISLQTLGQKECPEEQPTCNERPTARIGRLSRRIKAADQNPRSKPQQKEAIPILRLFLGIMQLPTPNDPLLPKMIFLHPSYQKIIHLPSSTFLPLILLNFCWSNFISRLMFLFSTTCSSTNLFFASTPYLKSGYFSLYLRLSGFRSSMNFSLSRSKGAVCSYSLRKIFS